jgi:hypothetical protein
MARIGSFFLSAVTLRSPVTAFSPRSGCPG